MIRLAHSRDLNPWNNACEQHNHRCPVSPFEQSAGMLQALLECPRTLAPFLLFDTGALGFFGIPDPNNSSFNPPADAKFLEKERRRLWEMARQVRDNRVHARHHRANWASMAFLIAFVRANTGHVYQNSALSIVKLIYPLMLPRNVSF
jgi:hypothetical protein